MLTLNKPQQAAKSASIVGQGVTLASVYRSLVKQTNAVDSMVAGFINATVELSHDCSMDADHSLITPQQYSSVRDFVSEFYSTCHADLLAHYNTGLYFHCGMCGVGSDLFLTVAGHGVGFWELETGKPLDAWCEQWHCEAYAYNDDLENVQGYEIMLSRYH